MNVRQSCRAAWEATLNTQLHTPAAYTSTGGGPAEGEILEHHAGRGGVEIC